MNRIQRKTQIYFGSVCLMVLIISAGTYLWFSKVTEKSIEELFAEKANIQTQLLGSSITVHMNQVFSDINMLAELSEVKNISDGISNYTHNKKLQMMRPSQSSVEEQKLYKYFQLYADQHVGTKYVYLATESAGYLVWPEGTVVPNFDPRVRPWYLKGLEGHGKVVQTDPYIDLSNNQFLISNVRSFRDSTGKVRGIVGIDTTMSHLAEMATSADITDSDVLIIVHPSGLVLFNSRNPKSEPQYLKDAEPELVKELHTKAVYHIQQNGKIYYGKTLTMPDLGWHIMMLSERSSLLSKNQSTIQKYITGAFVSALGILLIVIGGSYLLFYNRSLQKLVKLRTKDLQEIIDTLILKENAIRKSEERYSTLVDNIPGVVFRCDNHAPWVMQTITSGVGTLTGYGPEEFLRGEASSNWGNLVFKDDEARVNKVMEEATGKDYEIEYRIHHKNGELKWVYERGSVIVPEDGPSFIDGIIFDITERKAAEEEITRLYAEMEIRVEERTAALKSAMNQLVEQEKMASLGAIVSGVAHEINTPLGIGITTTSYLKQELDVFIHLFKAGKVSKGKMLDLMSAANESVQMLETNLTRAAELINTFKLISVNQITEDRSGFNFKEYVQTVLMTLNHKYKNRGVTIVIECPDDLEIYSYPGAISQLFMIFLLNTYVHGFKAQTTGNIKISANVSSDGERLNVVYEDDGVGIPEHAINRIFEPFYRVERTENGSGLGLYIAYNIVTQKLGGHISCRSKLGVGTTFSMDLPYYKMS